MRFGSLFAGIGGFDLGLERAGMEPTWSVEISPFCNQILSRHFPRTKRHRDVTKVGRADLPPVELVCGGFPCQDLSVAGSREGLAGKRSGLFTEFMRVLDIVTPRWVLIENVPGLLSSNGGRDMGTVVGALGERGYGWSYRVFDTQYFGPPQRRRRVFIVGHLGAPCPPEILFEEGGLRGDSAPSRRTREEVASATEEGSGSGLEVANTIPTKYRGDPHEGTDTIVVHPGEPFVFKASYYTRGKDGAPSEVTPPLSADADKGDQDILCFDPTQVTSKHNRSNPQPGDPSPTLAGNMHPPVIAYNIYPTKGQGAELEACSTEVGLLSGRAMATERGTRVVQTHPESLAGQPRRLTPVECERLHGFPDGWTEWGLDPRGGRTEHADTPRYHVLGNAVSVPVAHWIGQRIARVHSTITEISK